MTATSYQIGTVIGGEATLYLYPKYIQSVPKPGVMFVHGAGSGANYCISTLGAQAYLTDLIVSAGFTAISGDIGGPDTWGNSTATNAVTAHRTRLLAAPGVKPGKIALVSASMGGLTSLNWAAENPSLVSCIVSVIPVIHTNDIAVNDRGGYGASCNAAYGGWSEATYGATRNPLTMAGMGKFAGIPMLLIYGLTDTLCLPQWTEQFATAVGSNVTLQSLPSGHDFTSYSLVDQPGIVSFLQQYNV